MALNQHVEWDLEEVVAGYDFSSIFENTTVPVISSVVNTTDLAGPAANITAGLNKIILEVVKQMVASTTNPTITASTSTPTMRTYSTTAPPSSSTSSSVSTIIKKVVEHLGGEPNIPVATVCIFFKE